jgi:hypothetical protein
VHLATPGPLPWAALLAARALGIATTSDFRTNFHQYTRHYGLGLLAGPALGLMRRFHNLTRLTSCRRSGAARARRGGLPHLTVVGRGVDGERFTPAARSDALARQWQAGPTTPVLLAVGRIAAGEEHRAGAAAPSSGPRATSPSCAWSWSATARPRTGSSRAPGRPLRRRQARRRAGGALRLGRRVPLPALSDTFGKRRHGGARLRAAGGGVRLRRAGRARRRRPQRPAGRARRRSRLHRRHRSFGRRSGGLQSFREAAVAAARRATWDEVLERFEARLQDTVDAYQASPEAVPVVA